MKSSTKNFLMLIVNIIISTFVMDLVASVCIMSFDMFMDEIPSSIIGSILGSVLTIIMWYWQGWRFGNADYVDINTFKQELKRSRGYIGALLGCIPGILLLALMFAYFFALKDMAGLPQFVHDWSGALYRIYYLSFLWLYNMFENGKSVFLLVLPVICCYVSVVIGFEFGRQDRAILKFLKDINYIDPTPKEFRDDKYDEELEQNNNK